MNISIHLWSFMYTSLVLIHFFAAFALDITYYWRRFRFTYSIESRHTHPMKTATFRRPEASQEMSVSDSLVIQVGFYYASKPLLNGLPPRKLTWQWKIHHLKLYCISYWKCRFSNVMLVLKSVSFALHLEYGINPVAPGKYDKPSNSIKNIDWPKAAWNSFINR